MLVSARSKYFHLTIAKVSYLSKVIINILQPIKIHKIQRSWALFFLWSS